MLCYSDFSSLSRNKKKTIFFNLPDNKSNSKQSGLRSKRHHHANRLLAALRTSDFHPSNMATEIQITRFPGMDSQCDKLVSTCIACQSNTPQTHCEPLMMTVLQGPWDKVRVDFEYFGGPIASGDLAWYSTYNTPYTQWLNWYGLL